MNNDWETVLSITKSAKKDAWEMSLASLLLAIRSGNDFAISNALSSARLQLGADITAAGERGYRRAYDAVLKLHLVHDIEIICRAAMNLDDMIDKKRTLTNLFNDLSSRFAASLPTFRIREPILSMHRTSFSLR